MENFKTGRAEDAPRVKGKLSVQDTALNTEFFKEELDTVTAVGVVDEDQALALYEFELEDDVEKEELVLLVATAMREKEVSPDEWFREEGDAPNAVLREVGKLVLILLELQHDL